MKAIALIVLLSIGQLSCSREDDVHFIVHQYPAEKLFFETISSNGKVVNKKAVAFPSQIVGKQQNGNFVVTAIDKAYRQRQYLFAFDKLIRTTTYNEDDFMDGVPNGDSIFLLKLFNENEFSDTSEYIAANRSQTIRFTIFGDGLVSSLNLRPSFSVVINNRSYLNNCFDVWKERFLFIDPVRQKAKTFYETIRTNYYEPGDWMTGSFHFKSDSVFMFSEYRFIGGTINLRIYQFTPSQEESILLKDISIPSEDYSVENMLFSVKVDGSIYVSQGKSIFLVKEVAKKIYESTNGQIVYLW